MVGQHVTGANNHFTESPAALWFDLDCSVAYGEYLCKEKNLFIAVLIFEYVINA
jgi:hypothetical protein